MNKYDFAPILNELSSAESPLLKQGLKRPQNMPTGQQTLEILNAIIFLLFPETVPAVATSPSERAESLLAMLADFLSSVVGDRSYGVAYDVVSALPRVKRALIKDAIAIYEGDPAAASPYEVMLCYPGFYAITVQRIAHLLYVYNIPYLPRIMTERAHSITGIDIHPGARIGESFCIDHGTGVVIGETAEIGNNVKIYQSVTIGAKSFERDDDGRLIKGKKRHPTIGNNCVIYAGATILGGDTRIGDGCVIGGNVWLTHSLSPHSRVYYNEK